MAFRPLLHARSNEINAIPEWLDRLALRGALVTIDAMGRRTRIAQKILDRDGDYPPSLKDNQTTLHDDIAKYSAGTSQDKLDTFQTTDGDHDRIFHEDLSRLRSKDGPRNMATIRHMALNLIRGANDRHSLEIRRKSAAWDTANLEKLIRQRP